MPTVHVKHSLQNPLTTRRSRYAYKQGQGSAARSLLGKRPHASRRMTRNPNYQAGYKTTLKSYQRETNPAFYKAKAKRTGKKALRTVSHHATGARRSATHLKNQAGYKLHTKVQFHPTPAGYAVAVAGGVVVGAAVGYAIYKHHKRTVIKRHGRPAGSGNKHRDSHGRFA